MSDYVELTGDNIPRHPRLDLPSVGMCDRCERETWDLDQSGATCGMIQPDGSLCAGTFVAGVEHHRDGIGDTHITLYATGDRLAQAAMLRRLADVLEQEERDDD